MSTDQELNVEEKTKIHFTLQGKGGVGKSFVSSLIAQHQKEQGKKLICVDTDPVNCTFADYKAFKAIRLDLMNSSKINERKFDELMEMIFSSETDFVVDNGASSFIPMSNYLIENNAIEMLIDTGKQVVIHPVITGGQALLETLNGFNQIADHFPESADIILWLNQYFGDISDNGKSFEEMKTYQKHKNRVKGILTLQRYNNDTFGKDIEMMLNSKMTFDEAIESPKFQLMAKQRLKLTKKALWAQMDLAL